jgi:hypothetical protein
MGRNARSVFLILVATTTVAAAVATVTEATVAAVTTAITVPPVASTITAAIVAIAETATTAVAEGAVAFSARTGLVHHEVAPLEILAIVRLNGGTAGGIIGHLNESEATAPIGDLVHDDLGRGDLSEGLEKFTQVLVPHGVGHVGDINVHEFY